MPDDGKAQQFVLGDFHAGTLFDQALMNVTCVIHLAGKVHTRPNSRGERAAYKLINVDATLNLARQAAQAGVRRFIFMSTSKVYGESSIAPFTERERTNPQDLYALSKLQAEQGLRRIVEGSDMELIVLRPPLVYGPGVGANFLRLLDLLARRKLLPLGAIHNRRSLISLDNVLAAIRACITHPQAGGQIFNLSDCEDVSTTELIYRLGTAMQIEPRLLRIPPAALRMTARVFRKGYEADKLLSNFQLDCSHLRRSLDWAPISMEKGLAATAKWYCNTRYASHE